MNILLVHNICAFGGTEAHLAALASGLINAGHDVKIYFYSNGNGSILFSNVCQVETGPLPSFGEVLINTNPDVIHTTVATIPHKFFKVIDRVGYRGAVVVACHADMLKGYISKKPNVSFVSVSNQVHDDLKIDLGLESSVIYNGIDFKTFSPGGDIDNNNAPILLWVGRSYGPEKDYAGFYAVASLLVEKGWNVWVVDASPQSFINTLHDWLGTRCKITRGISQSGLAKIYRSVAHSGGCLLMTSYRETFGLVLAEAMACGCPVIAPRVGGIVDIVIDGVTGLIYERYECLDNVLKKVDILANQSIRYTLIENALNYVHEHFSVDDMVSQYNALYTKLVDQSCGKKYNIARKSAIATFFTGRRIVRSAKKLMKPK